MVRDLIHLLGSGVVDRVSGGVGDGFALQCDDGASLWDRQEPAPKMAAAVVAAVVVVVVKVEVEVSARHGS